MAFGSASSMEKPTQRKGICLDITTMTNGKIVWTGTITVAADGKTRTVTINGTDANGKKFKGKAVYDKE
jgi:hypothetical protein